MKTSREFIALQPRSIAINRAYRVLSIEAGHYRLWGDGDDDARHHGPYLFEAPWFGVLDATEPTEWVTRVDEDGARSAEPAAFERYTWESYFDDDSGVVAVVHAYLERCKPLSWPVAATERVRYERGSREWLVECLRMLASPARQLAFVSILMSPEVTERVIGALSECDWPSELSASQLSSLTRVQRATETAFESLGSRAITPRIEEFVLSDASRQINEMAVAALRLFEDRTERPGESSAR